MKAIRVHENGGPEVLKWEDVPDPQPGEGQVLVRVKGTAVNFADYLMRIGAYLGTTPPFTPGLEAVGIVEAVGPGVQSIAPGQKVLAWGRNSYAELAVYAANLVAPMPEGLSFEDAAAIPTVFATAWHALYTLARLQPGERVLVHAAGSGVGSAAIQLAKQMGGWVVATAGQDWKLERARELGVDATINYSTQDVADEIQRVTNGEGVNVALEGVGKATFAASVSSLAPYGRLVIYGAPSGPRVELDTRHAIFRNLTLYGMSITMSEYFPESVRTFAEQALPWFTEGEIRPVVDRVYPIQEVGAAQERITARDQFGKLVLRVD